jgi:peptide/nickel transport system substrate-binding protein
MSLTMKSVSDPVRDGLVGRRSCMRLAALAALLLAGIQQAQAQETVVVGKTFLAASLDPARGNAGWALTSHGIGQNLFTVGRDGRVVTSLARDAAPIDERSWTIRLASDRRFSDGTPVAAGDVAAGLNRIVAENPAARAAGTLSFAAIDALTLKVTGDRPLPILPSVLAEWPFVVHRMSERGPVFTGPWQIAGFEPDRELTLEPNRFHPGAEQRPRIRLRRFGDGQALALAVQSGEVDLAFNVPVEALPRLRASADVTVKSFPVAYQYMAWINTARPALGDPRVRLAIDLAIDRDLLIQAINGGVKATGAYATTFPFATREPRPFDRARAAALLDEAGWRLDGNVRRRDGQGLRLVLLAYPQRPDLVTMQPVLRAEFAKLGIEVETRVSDNAQAAAREGNFDLMLWAQHTAPAGDPAFFPNVFLRSGAANNHARFASPALDVVLDRFAGATDAEARALIAAEAERIVFAQAPVAYLLTPVWHVALSRRLAAYEPWGSDYYVLRPDLRSSR